MAALDFRNSSPPHPPAYRRHRRPLLVLFLIGLVLILADRLRDPNLRQWLSRQVAASSGLDEPDDAVGDNARAVLAEQLSPLEQSARKVEGTATLRDDEPSLADEQSLTLQWFDLLKRVPTDELRRQSNGPIGCNTLLARPDAYRGRLVTIAGVVRRIDRQPLAKNSLGLHDFYQLWVYPRNRPVTPVVVCCLTLPPGFPVSEKLVEPIRATGLFVKRWAYQAADGVRIAPLVLTPSIEWRPPEPVRPQPPEDVNFWLMVKILIPVVLLTLVGSWYAYRHTNGRRRASAGPPPDFTTLDTDRSSGQTAAPDQNHNQP